MSTPGVPLETPRAPLEYPWRTPGVPLECRVWLRAQTLSRAQTSCAKCPDARPNWEPHYPNGRSQSPCGPQLDGADVGGALRARRRDGRADALRRRPEQARAARSLQRVRSRGLLRTSVRAALSMKCGSSAPDRPIGVCVRVCDSDSLLVTQQNGPRDRRQLLKVCRVRLRDRGEPGLADLCSRSRSLARRCVSHRLFHAGVCHDEGTADLSAEQPRCA